MYLTPGKAHAFPGIYCKVQIAKRTMSRAGFAGAAILHFPVYTFYFAQ